MCDTDRAEDAHGLVSGLGGWPLFPELAYGHLHHLRGLRICRSSQVRVNNARLLGRSARRHPSMAQAAGRESRARLRRPTNYSINDVVIGFAEATDQCVSWSVGAAPSSAIYAPL